MVKGIRDLREIQIKFQTPIPPGAGWGNPAVPTVDRIVGQCGMKQTLNRVFPTEATGVMSSHITDRYYDPWVLGELPINTGDEGLTFQQFPWYLAMGALGGAGIGPVAGIWTFAPALATGDMPNVATIYYGDTAGAWATYSCFARQLVISGAFQGTWNMEADIVGRSMVAIASLVDIAYPTPLNTMLGQMTSLNTHPNCGFDTPTAIPGSLIDWRVTIPGFHAKFFQDGALYYSIMGLASRSLTFEATVEWDSTWSKIEHDNWLRHHYAATPSQPIYWELVVTGGPTGGVPATYSARIRMNMMYESFETLEERDGNDIVKFVARTVYDAGGGCLVPEWQIIVENALAGLP